MIAATFSEAMDPATINSTTFLVERDGVSVSGQVAYDPENRVAQFQPESRLSLLAAYTATITTAVTDVGGTQLASEHTWGFTVREGVWGTAVLIETENAGDAKAPQVAFDGEGNATAVWLQSDGTRDNVWANRFVVGSGWGTPQLIENDNAGAAVDPQVGVDDAGNAIAVWSQSDGTRDNLMSNRFVPGTGWGTAQVIETDNTGPAIKPQVSVDAAGNAVAVWLQWDSSDYNVLTNRFVPGTGWGTAERIDSESRSGYTPDVAVDEAGNAIVVWAQADGTRNNIWANRYSPAFGWGTAQLLETDNSTANGPRVVVDAAGNAIAVWAQGGDVWTNRFMPGNGWGIAAAIDTYDAIASPEIDGDANGNVIAIWSPFEGTTYSIRAKVYVPEIGWATAELLETDDAGPALSPNVALDAMGNAVAIWQQSDGTRTDVWAARFVVGVGWGIPELVEIGAGPGSYAAVAVDAAGAAAAVWAQSDGTRTNVWANSFR